MNGHILAMDQGTTSSRAIVFNDRFEIAGLAQEEFKQHFPASGWVEHDPEDIWNSSLRTARSALEKAELDAADIAGIGITNQRETALIWDRRTGEAIHKAIVWQDRRTSEFCATLKADGHEADVAARTGLLLDPYFSGTKVRWLLENVEGARADAEAGHLLFGTVDSYLIWRMTGGKSHVTDATNASRTLLYNIHANDWDDDMLDLFGVPRSMLPTVLDCAGDFGTADKDFLGAPVRILGVAGDQQAATLGNACFQAGMVKSTYGTGCFAILNTGADAVASRNRLLTTIAYRLDGRTTYALEGSIFIAGAAVQWLRDGLGLVERAEQSGDLAEQADPHQNVILVPAFTGLGAPYWDAEARGAIFGLTRGTGPKELARAALEAVCFQTHDLIEAMKGDWPG
ncbi:MAG TPA: glycerol kinase, partial [Afifellaceae bacterium]|nr:glycerol kinase [Afifellaceae bacterium]